MEDFTLRMWWELVDISDMLDKPLSITKDEIQLGDFKYYHSHQRLDEALPRAVKMCAAFYKKELYPHMLDVPKT